MKIRHRRSRGRRSEPAIAATSSNTDKTSTGDEEETYPFAKEQGHKLQAYLVVPTSVADAEKAKGPHSYLTDRRRTGKYGGGDSGMASYPRRLAL
jgi:hypothetical protein